VEHGEVRRQVRPEALLPRRDDLQPGRVALAVAAAFTSASANTSTSALETSITTQYAGKSRRKPRVTKTGYASPLLSSDMK
jgi:hypothetical protein